jgi:rfaE bifunctional protein nucleotidyltransferase chain/domain
MRKKGKAGAQKKIVSAKELFSLAKRAKKQGKKIVTTNGCFDLLHVGHVRSFAYAKSLGDILIVGVNSDASVKKNKGPLRPIIPASERAEIISNLSSVDYIFVFSTKTAIPWLAKVRPDYHVKGSDYPLESVIERNEIENGGGKVMLFTHTRAHSTSLIIKKIRES